MKLKTDVLIAGLCAIARAHAAQHRFGVGLTDFGRAEIGAIDREAGNHRPKSRAQRMLGKVARPTLFWASRSSCCVNICNSLLSAICKMSDFCASASR